MTTITVTGVQASTQIGSLGIDAPALVDGLVRETLYITDAKFQAYAFVRETLYDVAAPANIDAVVRESLDHGNNLPQFGVVLRETLRTTSFVLPHMLMDNVVVSQFPADTTDRDVTLRWSDDAGASWSNGVLQSVGNLGQYDVVIQYRRLGHARTRTWEITWSCPVISALTGVWVNAETAGT